MRILLVTVLLGACAGQIQSETRLIEQRGGEVIYLTNGACVATVSSADDEFNVLLPPSFCRVEE